jgi:hypothetical protein
MYTVFYRPEMSTVRSHDRLLSASEWLMALIARERCIQASSINAALPRLGSGTLGRA